MFSFTVKVRSRGVYVTVGAIAMVMAGMLVGLMLLKGGTAEASTTTAKRLSAARLPDNRARVDFLKSLGWEVDEDPQETVDVLIPQQFDKVYQRYNELQKQQGFNLEKYKGKAVKRYTYVIHNVPQGEVILADLFLYGDRLVAGDINNVALDGYMIALNQPLPK